MPRRSMARRIFARGVMPRLIAIDVDGDGTSDEGQQHPHGSIQPPNRRADNIDERVAGLISSNALPASPPASPTLYSRLQDRCNEVRQLRRQLRRQLQHLDRLAANFQHVQPGRRFFLRLQYHRYIRRMGELEMRMEIFNDFLSQNPGIHPDDVMDSSDDEEEVFGQEPRPMGDYGRYDGDGPRIVTCHVGVRLEPSTITVPVPLEMIEAYGEGRVGQRRVRRARRSSRHRQVVWRDAGDMPVDEGTLDDLPGFLRPGVSLLNLRSLVRRTLPSLQEALAMAEEGPHLERYDIVDHNTEEHDTEEHDTEEHDTEEHDTDMGEDLAGEGENEDGEGEDEDEDEEDEAVGVGGSDDMPSFDGEEDGTSAEARENNARIASDPDRPHNWQPFHQYFMYSCRGDITAVTNELQATFNFEPAVRRIWVGAQLNQIGNIGDQLEYLEGCLPGESGTIDRARARQEMASLEYLVPDIYDGINTGQIFDIDPTSDAYTEPVRPADLPPTWTSVVDATLLAVLPESPSLEGFWVDHEGVLEELYEDGIGFMRKENAMNMRCGQLRYLKLSEEDLAGSREFLRTRRAGREYLDPWSADAADTEMAEVATVSE